MARKRAWLPVSLCAGLMSLLFFSCTQNHRPDAPAQPVGPDSCIADSIYTFTTVATDPDGDSLAIRVDWGDSSSSHWVGWFASGETVSFTHAWADTGAYAVQAWAEDKTLLISDSSPALLVQVEPLTLPQTPAAPSGPDSGNVDSTYTFTVNAYEPDEIPVAMRFAWGDGDTSDWSDFVYAGYPIEHAHAWTAPGSYGITAQAKDTNDLLSAWSAPDTVVVSRPIELMMVGVRRLSADSSGFLVNIINAGAESPPSARSSSLKPLVRK